MKINLSNKDLELLKKLLEEKQINMAISDMAFELFYDVDAIKYAIDENDYLYKMFEYWELEDTDENIEVINKRIAENLKKLNPAIIKDNPYYKNIKLPKTKIGNYSYDSQTYKAFQCFSYDDIKVDENYNELLSIGYFDTNVSFPILKERNNVWMSLNPNEIITMQKSIDEATGNVLVFGLGLGYYAYIVSNKENVKSVTIIEKDPTIIELFEKHIKPQLKNKEKIKIIKTDAFEFLKKKNNNFDYAFVDLWHDANDGLEIYLKFKKEERNFSFKFSYWLETSLIALYRRCLLEIIEEHLNGVDEKIYSKSKTKEDEIINNIFKKIKNIEITSYVQILNLISDTSIKELILL